MNKPLLSVIIPVYKVEQYLRECVDSVINQSYSNLEIILIDDGSPDKCPDICDEYKNIDERIYVVHQTNQGLSMARNRGIKESHGDFITFLDSDDFVDINAYEILMKEIDEHDADIGVYGVETFIDGEQIKECSTKNEGGVDVLETKEVIKKYMYDRYNINVISCNKVFKRCLFYHNEFPQGKLFEDFVPVTKTILQSNKIVKINSKMYHYRKRNDSINGISFSRNQFNTSVMDLSEAIDEVVDLVRLYDLKLLKDIMPACINSKTSIVNQMVVSGIEDKQYVKSVQKMIKNNLVNILYSKGLTLKQKIKLLVLLNYSIYKRTYSKIKKSVLC